MGNWPDKWIRVERNGRPVFVGYVAEAVPEGDQLRVTAHEPEKLITDTREPPFPPPLGEHVVAPQVFEFWWKQLGYVFDLANPHDFPPLPALLDPKENAVVERYVRVASDLAASGLLNALREGFSVRLPDGTIGPVEVEREFSPRDLQVGFATLLRQCDSPSEPARFERVRSILWLTAERTPDSWLNARHRYLAAWGHAAKALHLKTLNQLLRDKLVSEGVRAVAFEEEHSPQQLLSIYNYGDLIHWGDRSRDVANWEEDDFVESDRRLAYLDAAAGLAHLYIGFGELARQGIGAGAKDLTMATGSDSH